MIIINLLLLYVSILGVSILVGEKLKLKFELVLPIVFASLSLILMLAGYLNMLKEIAFLIFGIGIYSFIYYLINPERRKKLISFIKNPAMIVFLIISLYLFVISRQLVLIHYDNFSHWALVAKQMISTDRLPNIADLIKLKFTAYPTGSANIIYFINKLIGFSDQNLIFAHNIITLVFTLPIFILCGKKSIIKSLIIALLLLVIFSINNNISVLLVDTLLSLVFVSAIIMVTHFKKDTIKLVIIAVIFSSFLVLIKNSGLLFSLFISLYASYYILKNSFTLKKKLMLILIVVLLPLVVFFSWYKHTIYAFPYRNAQYSKHAVSLENFKNEATVKSTADILKVKEKFSQRIKTFDNNLIMLVIINIILILSFIYNKKDKKFLILTLLFNGMYLIYLVGLYFMYRYSMPMPEAKVLAGYGRYILTIITVLLYLTAVVVLSLDKKNNKTKYLLFSIYGLMIILLLIPLYKNSNLSLFIGRQEKNPAYYEMENLTCSNYKADNKEIVLYSKSLSHTYVEFFINYKMKYGYTLVTNNKDALKNYDVVIVLDKRLERDLNTNMFKQDTICSQFYNVITK